MADPEKNPGIGGLGSVDPQERAVQLQALAALLGTERNSFQAELMRLNRPEGLDAVIDVMSAVAIGLPALRRTEQKETVWVGDDGRLHIGIRDVEVIKTGELMQIFMSPDFMFDRSGAGYYARLALDQALDGTGRMDVLAGLNGPGKFSKEEALAFVNGRVEAGEEEGFAERLVGMLRPEALGVVETLAERSGEHKARKQIWKAFAEHQSTGGDEKSYSELFVTPGHSAPQGPDWQAFFDDRRVVYRETGRLLPDGSPEIETAYSKGHRDSALRVIYAAGLTFEELVAQKKFDLLIPGLHYEARGTRSFWEATDENADKMEKGFDAKMAEAEREVASNVPENKRKWRIGELPRPVKAEGENAEEARRAFDAKMAEAEREVASNVPENKRKWRIETSGAERVLFRRERVLIKNMNIYAEGWGSNGFREWFDALEKATEGDLLAIYDAWYAAIVTGLVADVAVKGKKVGDPPLTASLHAWTMHFGAKQANEAGYKYEKGRELDEAGFVKDEGTLGARFKWNIYRGKTGPVAGIGKYPARWAQPFFKLSTMKERTVAVDARGNVILDPVTDKPVSVYAEKSIFDLWWKENRELATLNWVSIERPDDSIQFGESEVPLNSFDGWLYSQFQMYKMLAAVQGIVPLRDLNYTYWDGAGRSWDKAFGMVYLPIRDGEDMEALKNQGERRKDWMKNGGREEDLRKRRVIVVDGIKFVQVVPDERNPRYQLVKGILDRYAPNIAKRPLAKGGDVSVSMRERFTELSEIRLIRAGYFGIDPSKGNPGTPIETFIQGVVDAGLLSIDEMMKAIDEAYGAEVKEAIIANSEKVARMCGRKS